MAMEGEEMASLGIWDAGATRRFKKGRVIGRVRAGLEQLKKELSGVHALLQINTNVGKIRIFVRSRSDGVKGEGRQLKRLAYWPTGNPAKTYM